MKEGSLKVVVAITEAYPTLISAMSRVPEAVRSERLKVLALMGLQVEKGVSAVSAAKSEMKPNEFFEGSGKPLKLAVVLNAAQPRLYADINWTPPRLRAERLRSLATIGWQIEIGGIVASGSAVNASPDETPPHQTAIPKPKHAPPAEAKNGSKLATEITSESEVKAAVVLPSDAGENKVKDADAVGSRVRNFARLLGGLD